MPASASSAWGAVSIDVKKKIFQTSFSGGSYSSPEENENLYLKDYNKETL
jgi:hypothetical protein